MKTGRKPSPHTLPSSAPRSIRSRPVTLLSGGVLLTALAVAFGPVSSRLNHTLPTPSPSLDQVLRQSFAIKYEMALALASATEVSTPTTTYTVRSGETLESIAQAHGLSTADIMRVNRGPVDFLHSGQKLALPVIPGATRSPDALSKVAAPARTYIWPLIGPILPTSAVWTATDSRNSLDIVAAPGTAVVAAQAGTVITAGRKYNGYGNMIDILHNDGTITRYAHAARLLVQAGEEVAQGQPILEVGCSGQCSQPHVRFEVRVHGEIQDPLGYLP